MKRSRVIAALSVVVVGAGVYFWVRAPRQSPLHFETTKVTRGNVIARVTATGTLSALVTVQVGTQVSGRVSQINVDFNSPVKKNEIIARIDPQLFNASVEQARANYVAAQANVEKAKVQSADAERQRVRTRQLRAEKLVAQADLDTADANADAAKAQVGVMQGSFEQARAQLHQAQVNLDYTTIISPINGVVISRSVDVGQTVASSLQAPTLFTIAEDLRKMQVDTSVAEADVGKLRAEMEAFFTVDAYPNERFKGTVRQIRNAAQTVQNVVTYDAVIDVGNEALKLKPGMTANVTFVYAEKSNVLRIPNAALRFRPPPEMTTPPPTPGGAAAATTRPAAATRGPRPRGEAPGSDRRTIWVLRGERPLSLPVRVGVSDGTLSEVVEGDVHDGDAVITEVINTKAGAGASPGGTPQGFRRGF